jgi:hypothetical protein
MYIKFLAFKIICINVFKSNDGSRADTRVIFCCIVDPKI